MKILWDEPKHLMNLDKHGFDFADLDPEFFAAAILTPTEKNRFVAIGRMPESALRRSSGRWAPRLSL
jgi:uncharacterized DUF497 family protein